MEINILPQSQQEEMLQDCTVNKSISTLCEASGCSPFTELLLNGGGLTTPYQIEFPCCERKPQMDGCSGFSTEADSQSDVSGLSDVARKRMCAWRAHEFAVTAEQGTRKTMEDQHIMLSDGIPFFGVYDGHGGSHCAEYLRDNLHEMIRGHSDILTDPEKAIRESILEADRIFLDQCDEDKKHSGSVCTVAVIVGSKLVVGNVGDCEAILCRDGAPVPLTVRHSPRRNPAEAARVIAAGGRIVSNRVGHPKFSQRACTLAVSRTIGDAGFKLAEFTEGKPSGVIAEADTCTIELGPHDSFIVMGCDGLWDVMQYQEVVEICLQFLNQGFNPREITEKLVDEAVYRGSTDNVTVAFVSCVDTSHSLASSANLLKSAHCSFRREPTSLGSDSDK